jgi:CheY-like chemotaxis protein
VAKILIVDDHPGMADAVAATVRSERYDAAVVYGGADALEYIRTRPVDLVVLDAMMPGVSGFDVLEALRSEGAAGRPPVVMYSGNDLARDQSLRLGAVAFVSKVEPAQLLEAIDEHTGRTPRPSSPSWRGRRA